MGLRRRRVCDNHCSDTYQANAVPLLAACSAREVIFCQDRSRASSLARRCFTCPDDCRGEATQCGKCNFQYFSMVRSCPLSKSSLLVKFMRVLRLRSVILRTVGPYLGSAHRRARRPPPPKSPQREPSVVEAPPGTHIMLLILCEHRSLDGAVTLLARLLSC